MTYQDTSPFAKGIAELLERRNPKRVTSEMSKTLRKGRVFVDWSQNSRHKTTVCVYSLRALAQPTVSTPLAWDEVEAVVESRDPDELVFTAPEVVERVADARRPIRGVSSIWSRSSRKSCRRDGLPAPVAGLLNDLRRRHPPG